MLRATSALQSLLLYSPFFHFAFSAPTLLLYFSLLCCREGAKLPLGGEVSRTETQGAEEKLSWLQVSLKSFPGEGCSSAFPLLMEKVWVDAEGVLGYPGHHRIPVSSIAGSIPELPNQQLAARASPGGSLSFFANEPLESEGENGWLRYFQRHYTRI